MGFHYAGEDLIVRKIEVGEMENNVYVLECPETHEALLVDASFEPDKILRGVDGADIVAIVMTHGHGDHVQALPDLKQSLKAPVFAHPGDGYPVPVDRELSDGDTLAFGHRRAAVLYTPGHTAGGTCYLAGRHLCSGDTLFPGGPGATHGNKQAFETIIRSIETKLFVLPDETVVYPGHGADTTIGAEKPHLQEWVDRGW